MTTLTVKNLAEVTGYITKSDAKPARTKDMAEMRVCKAVYANFKAERQAKVYDAIMAATNVEDALQIVATARAEEAMEERVMKEKAETVSPGLARLRANPKAKGIREQVVADTEAAAEGVDVFAKKVAKKSKSKLDDLAKVIPEPEAKPAKAKKEPKPKAEGKTDRIRITEDMVITSVIPNPKKEGSKAAKIFALYQENKSVGDFIAACEKEGFTKQDAKSNIAWDRRNNFIAVEAA